MKKLNITLVVVSVITLIIFSLKLNTNKYLSSTKKSIKPTIEENLYADLRCGGCMKEEKMSSSQKNNGMKCSSGKCGGSMKEEKASKTRKHENKENANSRNSENTVNKKNSEDKKSPKKITPEKTIPEKVKNEESEMKCAPGKCG